MMVIVGFGCVTCCTLCFRCGCWLCLVDSLDLLACIGGYCICGDSVVLCFLAMCLAVSLLTCLVELPVGWVDLCGVYC